MSLSAAQWFALDYLAKCERATPRTLLRETRTNAATVAALRRRGLVRYEDGPTGIRRVVITAAGRAAVLPDC